jgi:hypothetical protein
MLFAYLLRLSGNYFLRFVLIFMLDDYDSRKCVKSRDCLSEIWWFAAYYLILH